ncbi:hypothetical protein [Aliihoeflea sp. 40Bstr573]|uniref:DUF6950 family protein n=1 Tax=Aliihoeflea sp. 40Bstr573 TaxID=2696467 RepID=UPI002095C43C|nr:hypothetical protein [Aliihoeflea sp. 40Bstr573]MCO6386346.1 hypothetical protein [Aliihoeflea sp. 40Bstr573]
MDPKEFVTAIAAEPFAWGKNDCGSIADRWIALKAGRSPLETYGRRHTNREAALKWLSEPGGVAVAVNRVMRANGFRRTKNPQPGDLGLVIFDGRMCIAIHAGGIWFSRHEDGLIGAPLDNFWKAWAV